MVLSVPDGGMGDRVAVLIRPADKMQTSSVTDALSLQSCDGAWLKRFR